MTRDRRPSKGKVVRRVRRHRLVFLGNNGHHFPVNTRKTDTATESLTIASPRHNKLRCKVIGTNSAGALFPSASNSLTICDDVFGSRENQRILQCPPAVRFGQGTRPIPPDFGMLDAARSGHLPNPMKPACLAVAIALTSVASAVAIPVCGTIKATITQADPGNYWGLDVGDVLMGTYGYDSAAIDGTFYGYSSTGPIGDLDGGIGTVQFQDIYNWDSYLTVSGGEVTAVDVNGESGSLEWWLSKSSLQLKQNLFAGELWVSGRVEFSAPEFCTGVPDGGSTFGFLLSGLGMAWFAKARGMVRRPAAARAI